VQDVSKQNVVIRILGNSIPYLRFTSWQDVELYCWSTLHVDKVRLGWKHDATVNHNSRLVLRQIKRKEIIKTNTANLLCIPTVSCDKRSLISSRSFTLKPCRPIYQQLLRGTSHYLTCDLMMHSCPTSSEQKLPTLKAQPSPLASPLFDQFFFKKPLLSKSRWVTSQEQDMVHGWAAPAALSFREKGAEPIDNFRTTISYRCIHHLVKYP
jgi:hypothetical protein